MAHIKMNEWKDSNGCFFGQSEDEISHSEIKINTAPIMSTKWQNNNKAQKKSDEYDIFWLAHNNST